MQIFQCVLPLAETGYTVLLQYMLMGRVDRVHMLECMVSGL